VQPNETIVMRVEPNGFFWAKWLSVSPECAEHFDVTDFRIGKDSVFWSADPIDARLLPPIPDDTKPAVREMIEKDFPVAAPGIILTLVAQNRSTAPQPFRAAVHGLSIGA